MKAGSTTWIQKQNDTAWNGITWHQNCTLSLYSLDLAPSNYYLFGVLKDCLKGQHYEKDDTVQEDMHSWCKVMEWISTTVESLNSCIAGRNVYIKLEIL
jgi:hypothetical protein